MFKLKDICQKLWRAKSKKDSSNDNENIKLCWDCVFYKNVGNDHLCKRPVPLPVVDYVLGHTTTQLNQKCQDERLRPLNGCGRNGTFFKGRISKGLKSE